ncbi:hypothetical protein L6452_14547 [Arctium lappa]|uniref:Uncharacterized protein n=1 Tax=Arctium lappa TaxID=4217 RepID=A0ACB9CLD6_ARCLA|nr:hypothetical protein L6452_14547 [Arctium lappa]
MVCFWWKHNAWVYRSVGALAYIVFGSALRNGFKGCDGSDQTCLQRFFPEQKRSYNEEVTAKTVSRRKSAEAGDLCRDLISRARINGCMLKDAELDTFIALSDGGRLVFPIEARLASLVPDGGLVLAVPRRDVLSSPEFQRFFPEQKRSYNEEVTAKTVSRRKSAEAGDLCRDLIPRARINGCMLKDAELDTFIALSDGGRLVFPIEAKLASLVPDGGLVLAVPRRDVLSSPECKLVKTSAVWR